MGPNRLALSFAFLDAATADRDIYLPVPADGSWEVTHAAFIPDSDGAVTADNTEWRKITFTVGSVDIGQITTDANGTPAGASWVAGTAVTFGTALNATGANLLSSSVPLKIASLHNGSTGKVCKGTGTVIIERRR
jgi:hypothetical protein